MASQRPTKDDPAAPADWRQLRLWHIQPVRDILVLALVFGILYIGYILRPITVPMLLALLLAYLFEPLVQRITRSRHISRPGAALAIIAASFFVIVVPLVAGVAVGLSQAIRLVSSVSANTQALVSAVQEADPAAREASIKALPRGWEYVGEQFNKARPFILDQQQKKSEEQKRENGDDPAGGPGTRGDEAPSGPAAVPEAEPVRQAAPAAGEASPENQEQAAAAAPREPTKLELEVYSAAYTGIEWIRANADNLAKSLGQQAIVTGSGAIATVLAGLSALAFFAFSAFLTAFFFFFFCTGWGKVLDFWTSLIPERKKGKAFDLIAKMDRVIAGFVRGRLTICAIMMGVFTLAYWLIGVPVPFLVGPLVGLLFMVPFLHVISIPLGIILLWLQPSAIEWQNTWWWIIFAPIGVDVLGQFLDDWVLSPFIQGKTTEMDMPTILFASMAGGALAGMYGLLVAIPVAACIRILVKELFWPKFRRWARGEERDFLPISSSDDPAQQPPRKA